jgi:hypothetical protein
MHFPSVIPPRVANKIHGATGIKKEDVKADFHVKLNMVI